MKTLPILYAEDEENDAYFLRRAFTRAGIEQPLVVVADGQEAVDYCLGAGRFADRGENPFPCLILLDLNLPRKSGLEVLQSLRREKRTGTLPAIILTSSLQFSDIHRAYRSGANAYLVKPSKTDELTDMMRSLKNFWLTYNRWDRGLEDEDFGPSAE